jgi:hypothetical protein
MSRKFTLPDPKSLSKHGRQAPLEGEIQYLERLLSKQQSEFWRTSDAPSAIDIKIYFAVRKDRFTEGQAALKFFPECNKPGSGKKWASNPAISRVRRALARVEDHLDPVKSTVRMARRTPSVIRTLFGCSPDHLPIALTERQRLKRDAAKLLLDFRRHTANPSNPGPTPRAGRHSTSKVHK